MKQRLIIIFRVWRFFVRRFFWFFIIFFFGFFGTFLTSHLIFTLEMKVDEQGEDENDDFNYSELFVLSRSILL